MPCWDMLWVSPTTCETCTHQTITNTTIIRYMHHSHTCTHAHHCTSPLHTHARTILHTMKHTPLTDSINLTPAHIISISSLEIVVITTGTYIHGTCTAAEFCCSIFALCWEKILFVPSTL
mmetsp:Transcript_8967/g.33082  ORF Transcript_8967/g.33082 Transcript_8967/m.33082 type:complete len:120 (-) Transcript_8967:127-486(-)